MDIKVADILEVPPCLEQKKSTALRGTRQILVARTVEGNLNEPDVQDSGNKEN